MKIIRKLIVIMIAFALVLCALSACRPKDNNDPDDDDNGVDKPFVAKPVDGIPPIFDEGMSYYNADPSAFFYENNLYVYYTVNSEADGTTDNIAVRKAVKQNGSWVYGDKKIVLAPDSGKWDSASVSNASVIKGEFAYRGEKYAYLMAYQGRNNNSDINHSIGLAYAKTPDGVWIKADEPAVPYDASSNGNSWGHGQPSLVSADGASQVYLFYTLGYKLFTNTAVMELEFSDYGITGLSQLSMLPTKGLNDNNDIPIINGADFAIKGGNLYVVRNYNPALSSPALYGAVQVAIIPLDTIYLVDGQWSIIEDRINMLDLEDGDKGGWERVYNGAFVTDGYGWLENSEELDIMLTVSSWDIITKDFRYYQTIVWTTTKDDIE